MFHFFQAHMKKIFMAMLFVIIPSFSFYFVGISQRESRTAGEIFGKKISEEDFNRAYKSVYVISLLRYGNYFKQMMPYLNLEKEAWYRIMMLKKAKDMKIDVPDDLLKQELIGMFSKEGEKGFDPNFYENFVSKNLKMTLPEFEGIIRESVMTKRLEEQVMMPIEVSQTEIEKFFNEENNKLQFSYVMVDSADYLEKVTVKDEELKALFEKDKARFEIPERICLNYIFKKTSEFQDKINVTNEEIKDYYEQNKDEFEIVPPKDEKDKSQDKKITYKSLDSVTLQIREKLVSQKTSSAAETYFDSLYKSMIEKNEFSNIAKSNMLQIQTTSLFNKNNPPTEIGAVNSPQIKDSYELSVNDFCGPYQVNDGWLIIQVKEKLPSKIPVALDEVKPEVLLAYKKEHSPEIAKQNAVELRQKLIAKLDKKNFEEASKDLGVKARVSGLMNMSSKNVMELGFEPKVVEEVFKLKENEVSNILPVESNQKFIFGQVSKRVLPDMKEFEKDKAKYQTQALNNKRKIFLNEWLKNLEMEANIKVLTPVAKRTMPME